MKTKMDQDEFSKFLATKLLNIEHYSFDMFYDVAFIMAKLNECRNEHDTIRSDTYLLCLRSTGCDLISEANSLKDKYLERSEEVYKCTFVWNTSYFTGETNFCTVEKIINRTPWNK